MAGIAAIRSPRNEDCQGASWVADKTGIGEDRAKAHSLLASHNPMGQANVFEFAGVEPKHLPLSAAFKFRTKLHAEVARKVDFFNVMVLAYTFRVGYPM